MLPINLDEKLAQFSDHWSPRIVGELNGQQVKLVKLQGEFIWHHHEQEDELFYVICGELTMLFRDRQPINSEPINSESANSESMNSEPADSDKIRQQIVRPGEFIIVPKGVEHKPVAQGETHVMLFEPAATLNTGNLRSDRTVTSPSRI